jgi:NitT/TauT family transport system ATP-binding protein
VRAEPQGESAFGKGRVGVEGFTLPSLWRRAEFTALLVTRDIEAALLLATRVVVLGGRPARIRAELHIDRPNPRRRDDRALAGLRPEGLELLGLGATWAAV